MNVRHKKTLYTIYARFIWCVVFDDPLCAHHMRTVFACVDQDDLLAFIHGEHTIPR